MTRTTYGKLTLLLWGGGGHISVRASGVSVEILRKPVRFLQFLVEFIQKVVYIKIKIKIFFQLFQLFNVSKNQG